MFSRIYELMDAASRKFYQSQLADREAELDDIDERIEELQEKRRMVQEQANLCRARLGYID